MDGVGLYHFFIILIFLVGYLLITIEHSTLINKTAIALIIAVLCWVLQFMSGADTYENNLAHLYEHLSSISQIVFFLIGALAIVETINSYKGFKIIEKHMAIRSKKVFIWVVSIVSFFLSSILDNLTTTIIMVTLIKKLVAQKEDRLLMGGAVVIAANAGGAWTPIGDVTTTMLWIGGQLSTQVIIQKLFLPSLICMLSALTILSYSLKGEIEMPEKIDETDSPLGKLIFGLGVGALIFVPIFKITTGLPPFAGMMLGLGVLWLVTDLLTRHYVAHHHLKLPQILTKIDMSSVLFFFGILLCIDALGTAGILSKLAQWLDSEVRNLKVIAVIIGLISAVVDNVPLVAAAMGMYDLTQYPVDSVFWVLVAFCAGTGGSILVIGSAAGVAFMGLEKVHFFWYLRKIGIAAAVGYFAGIGTYLLLF